MPLLAVGARVAGNGPFSSFERRTGRIPVRVTRQITSCWRHCHWAETQTRSECSPTVTAQLSEPLNQCAALQVHQETAQREAGEERTDGRRQREAANP